jgi:quinol monooxygenase YgiN
VTEAEVVVVPYVHLARYSVESDQLETWMSWALLFLSATSRSEGLWSVRLLRERTNASRFFFVTVWRSQQDFVRAMSAPPLRLAKTAVEDVATAKEHHHLGLLDHVWGPRGFDNFLPPANGFVQLGLVHVPLANLGAWTPYVRNCASVIARQNGVTSYEVTRYLSDPEVFYVLRSYEAESFSLIAPQSKTPPKPSKEFEYAVRVGKELGVYNGARPAEQTDCVLIDGAFGGAARVFYREFMENLNPA